MLITDMNPFRTKLITPLNLKKCCSALYVPIHQFTKAVLLLSGSSKTTVHQPPLLRQGQKGQFQLDDVIQVSLCPQSSTEQGVNEISLFMKGISGWGRSFTVQLLKFIKSQKLQCFQKNTIAMAECSQLCLLKIRQGRYISHRETAKEIKYSAVNKIDEKSSLL